MSTPSEVSSRQEKISPQMPISMPSSEAQAGTSNHLHEHCRESQSQGQIDFASQEEVEYVDGHDWRNAEQYNAREDGRSQSMPPYSQGASQHNYGPSIALPFPSMGGCQAPGASSQRYATMSGASSAQYAPLPNGWTSQPYMPRAHSNSNLMPQPQHAAQRGPAFLMHQSRSAQDLHTASAAKAPSGLQPATAPWTGCPTTLAAAAQLATIGVGIGPGVNPHVAINGPCTTSVGSTNPPIVNTGNNGPMCVQPGDWVCSTCGFVNWRRRRVCMRCFPFADPNEMSSTIANGAYLAAQLAAGVEPPADAIANLAMSRRAASNASCTLPMTHSTPNFQLPAHSPLMDTRGFDRPAQSMPPTANVTATPHDSSAYHSRSNVNVNDLEGLMSRTLSMRTSNSSAASSAGSVVSNRTHDGSRSISKLASSSSLRAKMQAFSVPEAHATTHAATYGRTPQNKWSFSSMNGDGKDRKVCSATEEFLRRQTSAASLFNSDSEPYSTPEFSQASSDGTHFPSSSKSSFSMSSQSNGNDGSSGKLWASDNWTESPELSHLSSIRTSPQNFARTPRVSPLNISTQWLNIPQTWSSNTANGAPEQMQPDAEGKHEPEIEESLKTAQGLKTSPFHEPAEPRAKPTSAANELDEIFVPSAHDRRSNVQPISPSAYKTMMAAAAVTSMPRFAAAHAETSAAPGESCVQVQGDHIKTP